MGLVAFGRGEEGAAIDALKLPLQAQNTAPAGRFSRKKRAPRRHNKYAISIHARNSYNGVGCTRSVVGTTPFGKLMPQGRRVGMP